MTKRFGATRKVGILVGAGLSVAALAATGSPRPAHAQIDIRIGKGDFNISIWKECSRIGKVADPQAVRKEARRQGFRKIRNISLVRRRYGSSDICGFYRASAEKDGRRFRLYANANSARLLSARAVGDDPAPRRRVDERAARRILARAGFEDIRNLRQDKRGGEDVWIARAAKDGRQFRVFIGAENGKILRRVAVGSRKIDEKQARQAMRRAGFRKITNLRRADRDGKAVWIARAQRNGKNFRVTVRDRNGKTVLNGREIADKRLPEKQILAALRQDGFNEIRNLRLVRRGNTSFYAAAAWREGYRWNLRVQPESGEVSAKKRVGGRLDIKEARRRLRAAGYRRIEDLRWRDSGRAGTFVATAWRGDKQLRLVARGGDAKVLKDEVIARDRVDVAVVRKMVDAGGYSAIDKIEFANGAFVVTAWKDGYRYRLRARARDGKVVDRNRIGGRLSEDALRRNLGKAGYDRVGSIRFVDDGRAGRFVAIAWQKDRKYRLYARAESGKTYRRVLIAERISQDDLRRRLLARGFEKVDDVDLKKQRNDEDYYLASVWKNGHKYRIHARASDGVPYRRELLEPRVSKADIQKVLRKAGFEDVRDITFKEDRVGGHFEATARKGERKVHLHMRVHDGSVYRERELAK